MKRLATALGVVSIALVPGVASAQAPGARPAFGGSAAPAQRWPVRLGMTIGANVANLDARSTEVPDGFFDSKLGVAFGAVMAYPLSEVVSLQLEAVYSMKGATVDLGVVGIDASASVSLDYFLIPLLVQARFPTGGDLRPFLLAGPSLGLLLRANTEQGGISEDISDETNAVDVGLVLGAGVELATPRGVFVLGARYEVGVTDVPDTDGADPEDEFTNRAFTLSLGFLF